MMRTIAKLSLAFTFCSVLAWAQSQPTITQYSTPIGSSFPREIASGPDGALWFTEIGGLGGPRIGRIATNGTVTEYPIPTASSAPFGIAAGPDGALWFTEFNTDKIGRITTAGVITEYQIPTPISNPYGITAGPDGALWFTESYGNKIGRITTAGVFAEYTLPHPSSGPQGITVGPDGALWFAERPLSRNGTIGRISTTGLITEFSTSTGLFGPIGIAIGPDGALWFTEYDGGKIGRVTTAGVITEYATPTSNSQPLDIVAGPDGALWFTETANNQLGRITTSAAIAEYPMPPSSGLVGITAGPDGALWSTESTASKIARIAVGSPTAVPIISSATLPNGEIGFAYSAALTATGRSPPYANWILSNGTLPQGLTLNSSAGVISGTPVSVFTSNFSITVRDSTGATSAAQNFSIAIGAPVKILGPGTLPGGIVGIAYPPPGGGVTFSSTGGWPPQTWSATGLPAGMSMSPTGLLSGTPSTQGNYTPQFTVTDSINASVSVTLPLAIATLPVLQITTGQTLSTGIVGAFYSQLLLVSGGIQPYNWTLVSGTLPPGVSLLTGGVVSGTPTTTGSSTFTAKVTDAASNTQTQSYSITIGLGLIGSMPHLAAEGGWSTTFTVINKGAASAQTQLNLFDNNGNPLPLPLTFPQIFPPPPVAFNPQPSASTTLAPNALWVVEASGPANIPYFEGSAELNAYGNLDGFAIFHYDPSQQEAVVPMETRNAASYLLAFDNTNGVLTGVALGNVSSTAANIPVIVRTDTGAQIIATTIALAAFGHTSFVLPTQYPLTGNNRGTVEFDTPGFGTNSAQQISVLGIRYTGGTLTTIPVLANVGTSGGLMAHLASGNGWQTTFALVNTGSTPANATLNFFGDNGSPLPLTLTVLTGTNPTPLPGFPSSYTQTIAANSSLWLQTSGPVSSSLLTGSAQLVTAGGTSGTIGGYAVFRYNPNGQEAVVPIESRNAGAYLIAFDNTNSTATGVAISSSGAQSVTIPVILRDDKGAQIGTSTIQLNASGHTSFMLAQQFPQTANLRGTVEFDAPSNVPISVLGIRSPPALTFTTLPALSK